VNGVERSVTCEPDTPFLDPFSLVDLAKRGPYRADREEEACFDVTEERPSRDSGNPLR
jgi:hypothetical protein